MSKSTENNLPEKQAFTVEEVAALLGSGVATVWRQVKAGNLPQPFRIGGATRWRKAEIDKILMAPESGGRVDTGFPIVSDSDLRAAADLAHGLAEDGYAA